MSLKRSERNRQLYSQLSEENQNTEPESSVIPKEEILPVTPETKTEPEVFNNEYLDQFIQEVKQYNIQKGTRKEANTQLNILKSFRKTNEEDSIHPLLKKAPEEKNSLFITLDEEEEEENKPEEEPVPLKKEENSIPAQLRRFMEEPESVPEETDRKEEKEEKESENTKKVEQILQKTQDLETQMTGYQKTVKDVSTSVNKIGKVLDIVLVIIFLLLIAVLGVFVYYLLKLRGIL